MTTIKLPEMANIRETINDDVYTNFRVFCASHRCTNAQGLELIFGALNHVASEIDRYHKQKNEHNEVMK